MGEVIAGTMTHVFTTLTMRRVLLGACAIAAMAGTTYVAGHMGCPGSTGNAGWAWEGGPPYDFGGGNGVALFQEPKCDAVGHRSADEKNGQNTAVGWLHDLLLERPGRHRELSAFACSNFYLTNKHVGILILYAFACGFGIGCVDFEDALVGVDVEDHLLSPRMRERATSMSA